MSATVTRSWRFFVEQGELAKHRGEDEDEAGGDEERG